MREATYRGGAARTFDALSEMDQAQLLGLIHYLEREPEPDNRLKVPLNPHDEAQFLLVFDDRVWQVVYHILDEATILVYGITKYPAG